MWIIIAQIICLASAISLVATAYDLDKDTPGIIRYMLVALSTFFLGVFFVGFKGQRLYEYAAAVAFTGVGVLALVYITYLILKKQIQPAVLKVSGAALAASLLVWLVGSCADIKRQEGQIDNSTSVTLPDTARLIEIPDSTRKALEQFKHYAK
ncbi:hypothetical protein [Spirosoma fluminis]